MIVKNYTIKDISEGLSKKEFSAEEIFSHYLNKVGLKNKKLNVYLSVFNQQPVTNNSQQLLAGVPAAIKTIY